MHFTYCPHCGTKLINKEIGDEGEIPYCSNCEIPLWDMFTTSVICAVVNDNKEVALIRQNYVSETNYVCVAGIMKPGESAEDTVVREVKEELGLDVYKVKPIRTYPYDKKEMLMLGYVAYAKKAEFVLSKEVDSAGWFAFDEALAGIKNGSIAWQVVNYSIQSAFEIDG
ncbi:MAG: NUDIX domain-containing protein [Lachnospiraceae bacterium]|nr:NUDIX domain-containing protein [Lachnospiraceae bacterium]